MSFLGHVSTCRSFYSLAGVVTASARVVSASAEAVAASARVVATYAKVAAASAGAVIDIFG